jgi:hypothetical protein
VKIKRYGEPTGVQVCMPVSNWIPYDSPYVPFWNFGGPSCDGRHRVTKPFIKLRETEDDLSVTG